MNTERHDDPNILESAVDEIRRTGDSRGPSPQALERTREAMRAAAREKPGIRLAERIKHMTTRKTLLPLAAAAAVLLIAFAAWMLLPADGKGGVAFADVRRQVERTQTMSLTAVAEMKGLKKPMTMKMFFKSPGLMRQEITMDFEGLFPSPATKSATCPASAPTAMKMITIIDMVNQKCLGLVPSQKKAIVFEFKNLPAEELARSREQNLLDRLKEAVAGEHQELGEKTLSGKKAKGYRCKSPEAKQVSMDIWVDASSGEFLMVQQTFPESLSGIKSTMTDFVIDPKLDDSLFDTKVPEGYATENQAVDFSAAKEEDVVQCLTQFAKFGEGVFPKSLIPTPDLIKHMMELEKDKKITLTKEEAEQFGKSLQKAMLFQMRTMQGGEFIYAGEGVKLGDKATPILWYKAKDAKTYRVIYGDLRVEEADKAPARPPASMSAKP